MKETASRFASPCHLVTFSPCHLVLFSRQRHGEDGQLDMAFVSLVDRGAIDWLAQAWRAANERQRGNFASVGRRDVEDDIHRVAPARQRVRRVVKCMTGKENGPALGIEDEVLGVSMLSQPLPASTQRPGPGGADAGS